MARVDIPVRTTGSKKAEGDFKRLGGALQGSIKQFAGMALAAVSVGFVARGISDLVQRAGKVQGVARAFEQLGTNIEELKKATDGTVDTFTLMQTAVKASQLGVGDLAEKLEFAKLRARQTGEEVGFLTEQIILGIGRQSVMRMDDLGLSITMIRDRMKETGSFAEAISQIIKEELASPENQKILSELADNVERLGAAWKNVSDAFGDFIIAATNVKGSFSFVTEWIDKITFYFQTQAALERGDPFAGHIKVVGDAAEEAIPKVDALTEAYNKWVLELEIATAKKEQELGFMQRYIAESIGVVEVIYSQVEGYERLNFEVDKFGHMMDKQIPEAIKGVAKEMDKFNPKLSEAAIVAQEVGNQFVGSFDYMFTQVYENELVFLDNLFNAFKSTLERMVAEMLARAAVFGILSLIPGVGGTGSFFDFAIKPALGISGISPTVSERSGGGSTTNINMPNVTMINSKSISQINQMLTRHKRLH